MSLRDRLHLPSAEGKGRFAVTAIGAAAIFGAIFIMAGNSAERKAKEDEEKAMSTHEGEEFMVVVHGKIIVRYGKEEYILERGDSVYYNSVVSHFIGAIDGPAEILAVLYSPM